MIWFGWVLWHINPCRLFNAKSSLYIYIKYIWFGLVGFYGISTIVGYLMPNPLYTCILNIYDLVGLVLWHINHCRLFNAKSSLYMYIKFIWFGLVGFYGILTIVGYLLPNPVYSCILNIYDLLTHFIDNSFKRVWIFFFLHTVKWFQVLLYKLSKFADCCREWPDDSLFYNYYYLGVGEGATLFPGLPYPWSLPNNTEC